MYGGVVSENESAQFLSRILYSYDPNSRVWILLRDAPSARFLHSATFVGGGGLMLVFGGNTHNDTLHSFGAKCYSTEFLAYDVVCDSWHVLQVPKDIHADLARFGHSAAVFEGSLYIYGGFDGQMLSDMLKYTPGNCSSLTTANACLGQKPGRKCVWDARGGACSPVGVLGKNLTLFGDTGVVTKCPELNRSLITQSIIRKEEKCKRLEDCLSCVQTTSECVWCAGLCIHSQKCRNGSETNIGKLESCPLDPAPICKQLHTCTGCTSQPYCR